MTVDVALRLNSRLKSMLRWYIRKAGLRMPSKRRTMQMTRSTGASRGSSMKFAIGPAKANSTKAMRSPRARFIVKAVSSRPLSIVRMAINALLTRMSEKTWMKPMTTMASAATP